MHKSRYNSKYIKENALVNIQKRYNGSLKELEIGKRVNDNKWKNEM